MAVLVAPSKAGLSDLAAYGQVMDLVACDRQVVCPFESVDVSTLAVACNDYFDDVVDG